MEKNLGQVNNGVYFAMLNYSHGSTDCFPIELMQRPNGIPNPSPLCINNTRQLPCYLLLNRYIVCCQYSRYYCNCCSFMYCRTNKLKKWLFYIYLLTTITKALYQPSEKGMSLLFTCPQLTEESSLAAAARMLLHIM